jgi:hypothetical protein
MDRKDYDVTTYEQRDTSIQLHDYAARLVDWERLFTHHYIATCLERSKVKTLIDFCSGYGVFMRALQRWTPSLKQYIAVDIDQKKLQKLGTFWGARKRTEWNFTFKTYNIPLSEAFTTITEKPDAITYLFAIEHMTLEIASDSLRNAREMLQKNTLLFITFPNNTAHPNIPRAHLTKWEYENIAPFLKNNGFTPIVVHGLAGRWDPIKGQVLSIGDFLPHEIYQCMFYFNKSRSAEEVLVIARRD